MKAKWRVSVRPPKGKDGRRWQLRYFPPPGEGKEGKEGKSYQESTDVLYDPMTEAVDRVRVEAIAKARESELNGESLPFAELARRYVLFRTTDGETRPRTVSRTRTGLLRFSDTLRGRAITLQTVTAVQDELRQVLAPVTLNLYMGMAAKAWRWGLKRGLVKDAWPDVDRLTLPETKMEPFSVEETILFLKAAQAYGDGRYYPFFALVADIGSRVSETCAILERDLDRTRCTVRLRKTKTKSRTVYVTPEVMELLPRRSDPAEHVFQRVNGGPFNRHTQYAVWHRIKAQLGWEERPISPHSLRRSWIAASLANGVSISQSMRHTGHQSVKTHLDYQRNAPDQGMQEVAATVRRARPPLAESPTVPPPGCGGGELLSVATHNLNQEEQGLTRSRCTAEPEHTPLLDSDLAGLAPPQDTSMRTTLSRLALMGEDVQEALRALALYPSLRAFVIELTKPIDQ